MRALFFFTIFSIVLSSCVHIYFIEPQPKGGMLLNEIPEELHGQWTLGGDEVKIDNKGLITHKIVRDTLLNTTETLYERINLSDSFRLYKAQQFYVFNSREDDKNWEIVVIKKRRNGDIYFYENLDPEFYTKDRNLKLVSAIYSIEGHDTIVQNLNRGSVEFQSAIFSGQMKLRTIKKIARKENVIYILKEDGTVFFENVDEKN